MKTTKFVEQGLRFEWVELVGNSGLRLTFGGFYIGYVFFSKGVSNEAKLSCERNIAPYFFSTQRKAMEWLVAQAVKHIKAAIVEA